MRKLSSKQIAVLILLDICTSVYKVHPSVAKVLVDCGWATRHVEKFEGSRFVRLDATQKGKHMCKKVLRKIDDLGGLSIKGALP